MFVLDGSGSIGSVNFLAILQFVEDTVNGYDIGPDQTRVGLIQYASSVRHEFDLDSYSTKNNVINAIKNVRYMVSR